MKRGNGQHEETTQQEAEGLAREETPAPGPADPAKGGEETPTGLQGVDAQPLPPPSREQIEALRRECDELRDQLLRKRAEFANYRGRVERDRHEAGAEAVANLLKALLPTLDDLERALDAEGSEVSLREGGQLIRRGLLAVLDSQGVAVEDPKGQRFDPSRHQALVHEVVAGFEEGMIVEVLRKGYSFKGRLLRPALVKVAKGEAPEEAEMEKVH